MRVRERVREGGGTTQANSVPNKLDNNETRPVTRDSDRRDGERTETPPAPVKVIHILNSLYVTDAFHLVVNLIYIPSASNGSVFYASRIVLTK